MRKKPPGSAEAGQANASLRLHNAYYFVKPVTQKGSEQFMSYII